MILLKLLNSLFIKSNKKILLKPSISLNKIKILFSGKNKNLQKMNSKFKKKEFMKLKKIMKMMKMRILINKMIIMIQVMGSMSMTIKIQTRRMKMNNMKNFSMRLLINRELKRIKDLKMKN
jgi:hypothetical protein